MVDPGEVLDSVRNLREATRSLAQATTGEGVLDILTRKSLNASGAVFVAVGSDGQLEVVASTYGGSQSILDDRPVNRDWPITDAIRSGQAIWLRTREETIARYPNAAEHARSAAWASIPLRVGTRLVGALGIGFDAPQSFDEPQRLYLLALADVCAIVLDNQLLSARRAGDELRALVDANVIGVFGGRGTRIREANDAFLNMLGLERSALADGIEGNAVTAPEFHDADLRAQSQADASGHFGPYEKEFVHADGHHVPVRVVGAITTADGSHWIALVEDLTAERRVEAELRAREARYRSLVEASNTVVWTADPTGRFVDANDGWARYTGQAAERSRDHGWLDAFHPDDRDRVFEALDDARRAGVVWQGHARVWHAQSSAYRRTVVRAVPLVEGDEIVEWVGTVTDVDDQARTEEVLRATTARLAALMRHAPVGFAFIDRELRFQVVNDKLAEINGMAAHEHLGRDVREVVPDLAEVNESLFRRVLDGEPILETEVSGVTRADPDHRRDWLVNYYPVRDQRGAILGIGATVIDVTERNQLLAAEREARSSAEASARLSQALSTISAAISNAMSDDVIAHHAGEHLADALGADGVFVARSDTDGRIEEVLYTHGYDDGAIAHMRAQPDPDSWSTGQALRSRSPVFYELPEEFIARFPMREALVRDIGARSWTVVPLVAGDQEIGFFVVMFRSSHAFTPDERRFVATVGDLVAQSMVRARSRAAEVLARRSAETLAEAIAAERARLAAVLQRMPAGLVVVDAIGTRPRVVLSNERAVEILGPRPSDDDADAWFVLRSLDGSLLPAEETPLHRALQGTEVVNPDAVLVVHRDGSTRRVRTTAVPIRDAEHRITSAVVVIEDVTEQARRTRDAQLLARVTDLIDSRGDVADVLERVATLAVPRFADSCGVYLVVDDELQLFAVADREPQRAAKMRELLGDPIPLSLRRPLTNAVREGQSILISSVPDDVETALFDAEQQRWIEHELRPVSVLIVPMRSGDRVTGLLTFSQTADTGRKFTRPDLEVAVELASRSSLLLEQLVAHRETARARDRADHLQRFAAAMARAASVDAVVQAIVVEGAEAVSAKVVKVVMRSQEESSLDVFETRVSDTSPVTWKIVDPAAEDASTTALQQGRPAYYRTVGDYAQRFPDGELELIANGVQAVAALPLFGSDGHVIGSIGWAFELPQQFDDQQCSFLETVADMAAQSLDRARLYERERDVARALQMALLPSALPELDDVVTEARYVAGGAGVSVGGDWYDVLRFADGRVGLLIGDAAGRGVEAATLMGKVRHAAAALAMDRESPAAVLTRVNEYLHNISSRRTMLTCCYAVLDRDRGLLRYASAGHPPPIVVEDGEPQFLSHGRGVPLGVIPTASYTDAVYKLHGAATIVLYTDGLIERRGETIDVGLERLLDAVRGNDADVKELCDHLTRLLLGDGSEDDVALLAARVQSVASMSRLHLELPADSRRLHELRARVTRWLTDAGVAHGVIPDIVIALNEAASNSMLHAYTNMPRRGHVHVSLAIDDNELTAVVSDDGRWRDAHREHDGRGLGLMHSLMNDVRVERADHGTRVHLVRAIDA